MIHAGENRIDLKFGLIQSRQNAKVMGHSLPALRPGGRIFLCGYSESSSNPVACNATQRQAEIKSEIQISKSETSTKSE